MPPHKTPLTRPWSQSPLAGSLKLRICTVLDAWPGSTAESGVAMMVISATVVWKLDSSLHAYRAWPLVEHTNTDASDTTVTGRAQVI